MKKVHILTFAVLLIISMVLAACKTTENADKNYVITSGLKDNEMIKVGSKAISKAEVLLLVVNQKNTCEATFSSEIWQAEVSGKSFEDYLKEGLKDSLARLSCTLLMADEMDITLTKQQEAEIESAAQVYYDTLDEADLSYTGATLDTVIDIYEKYYLADLVALHIVGDSTDEISDDESRIIHVQQIFIRKYTEDAEGNKTALSDDELSEALITAADVQKRAAGGEDFEVLAEKYNESSETNMTIGREDVSDAFEEVAFALDNGEISPVVETDQGFHIIRCINNYDVEATVLHKETLKFAEKRTIFESAYQEFAQNIHAEIKADAWAAISYGDKTYTGTTSSLYKVYNEKFGID